MVVMDIIVNREYQGSKMVNKVSKKVLNKVKKERKEMQEVKMKLLEYNLVHYWNGLKNLQSSVKPANYMVYKKQ